MAARMASRFLYARAAPKAKPSSTSQSEMAPKAPPNELSESCRIIHAGMGSGGGDLGGAGCTGYGGMLGSGGDMGDGGGGAGAFGGRWRIVLVVA